MLKVNVDKLERTKTAMAIQEEPSAGKLATRRHKYAYLMINRGRRWYGQRGYLQKYTGENAPNRPISHPWMQNHANVWRDRIYSNWKHRVGAKKK